MMNDHQIAIDTTIAAAASKATYAGAGTTVVGWLLSSEFGVAAGVLMGVLGLLINWYFRRKADRREVIEHEARMRKLTQDSSKVPL